jgi:putative flavoprotein involved in K+ transport
MLRELIQKTATDVGIEIPEMPDPEPFDPSAPERIDLTGFGAVIFCGGFRPDYGALAPWPEAFDEVGFPVHEEGASTVIPGLSFVGVHFLRKRKSSLLLGVGEDAEIVARSIGGR